MVLTAALQGPAAQHSAKVPVLWLEISLAQEFLGPFFTQEMTTTSPAAFFWQACAMGYGKSLRTPAIRGNMHKARARHYPDSLLVTCCTMLPLTTSKQPKQTVHNCCACSSLQPLFPSIASKLLSASGSWRSRCLAPQFATQAAHPKGQRTPATRTKASAPKQPVYPRRWAQRPKLANPLRLCGSPCTSFTRKKTHLQIASRMR